MRFRDISKTRYVKDPVLSTHIYRLSGVFTLNFVMPCFRKHNLKQVQRLYICVTWIHVAHSN